MIGRTFGALVVVALDAAAAVVLVAVLLGAVPVLVAGGLVLAAEVDATGLRTDETELGPARELVAGALSVAFVVGTAALVVAGVEAVALAVVVVVALGVEITVALGTTFFGLVVVEGATRFVVVAAAAAFACLAIEEAVGADNLFVLEDGADGATDARGAFAAGVAVALESVAGREIGGDFEAFVALTLGNVEVVGLVLVVVVVEGLGLEALDAGEAGIFGFVTVEAFSGTVRDGFGVSADSLLTGTTSATASTTAANS